MCVSRKFVIESENGRVGLMEAEVDLEKEV